MVVVVVVVRWGVGGGVGGGEGGGGGGGGAWWTPLAHGLNVSGVPAWDDLMPDTVWYVFHNF